MTINTLTHSQKFKKIISLYKVKRVAMFGSQISGHADKHSDYDFLVEFKPSADLLDQVGLKQDLEEILKKKVDIVTANSLSKYLRDRVLKEAVYL